MLHLIDSICGVDSNLSTTDRIGRQVFRETTYRVGLRCEDYRLVVTMRTNGGYNYIHGGPGDKYRHTDEDHQEQRRSVLQLLKNNQLRQPSEEELRRAQLDIKRTKSVQWENEAANR